MCMLVYTHIFSGSFCSENLETMGTVISYHLVNTKNLDLGVKAISQWKGQWLLTEMINSGAGSGKAQHELELFVILESREVLTTTKEWNKQTVG